MSLLKTIAIFQIHYKFLFLFIFQIVWLTIVVYLFLFVLVMDRHHTGMKTKCTMWG